MATEPFLHLCFLYFGFLGIRVSAIKWNSSKSIIYFGYTLLHSFFIISLMVLTYKIHKSNNLNTNAFGKLMSFATQLGFPIHFTIENVAYLFYGPSIAQLVDSPLFSRCFDSWHQARLVFATLLTINNLLFLVFFYDFITVRTVQNISLLVILRLPCFFIVHSRQYLTLFIIHYVKYATLKLLSESLNQQQQQRHQYSTSIRQLMRSIQTLALLNFKLNSLLSSLLAMFLVSNGLEFVALLYWLAKGSASTIVFSYILCTSVYLTYVLYLDNQLQILLTRISEEVKRRSDHTLEHLILNYPTSSLTSGLICRIVASGHARKYKFYLLEIEIYQEYFQLELYQLCTIDLRFLLNLVIFIVGFVLLVLQTDDQFEATSSPSQCSCVKH